MAHPKIKLSMVELKKLVLLLCQHKLNSKPTKSLNSEIQQYQVDQIFVFYIFCNLKDKDISSK